MPAIRKIRIVNFRFNDGTKLIPDEIFCTENAEGKPIDTLLNLENGGGKSVIVQLLMQPVCPKAKVQNRSISDYFQKGTDHAFVLIEWALDDSSNSLLTGIAMAASTTADDEKESKTIRFYTFIHDYTRAGDKLDLINLPLTERTGGHIHTMSFDDLRKYLQNRRVDYYPSDSLHKYQKRLEEYGILHTEWENILVRINSVEGGITKFFEEYRTADRLLDRFIIPGVMNDDAKSTEDLEKMFVNYADSYAGQEENLRLQSQIKSFTEKLQGILPLIKNMWEAEDSRIQAIHMLADHLFTLDYHIRLYNDKNTQIEKTISDLLAKLHHIKAEKASETFYLAKESFEKADHQRTECERRKDEADNRRDESAHIVSVLNAAKEYAELREQQNAEKALTAQIREHDRGTQDSRILSLKYSLCLLSEEMKKQTDRALSQEKSARKERSDALCDLHKAISKLDKKFIDENNLLNQKKGCRDILHKQIVKGLESLTLQITVMLDGGYSKEDIENIRLRYDTGIKLAKDRIENFQNEETQLEQEFDAQDAKRTELLQFKAECAVRLEQDESLLKQYQKAYNAVLSVLEHLSVPVSLLFSDKPISSLDSILAKLNEQLKQTDRLSELLTEQVRCIETGQLHLSKTAVSFLQESGVTYQTGEQYLNFQSPGIREDILAVNPLVAYAVIVESEKEQIKLLSQSADTWLSAIVPVYTRMEIADMADGKWNEHNRFLSAFDKEYFRDVSAYKNNIQKRLDDAKAETEHLKHLIGEWEAERNILSQFTYSADYEKQLQNRITSCKEELGEIKAKLSSLDKRKTEIRERTDEIHKLEEEQQNIIYETEKNNTEFEHICSNISQYEDLGNQIAEKETLCRQIFDKLCTERKEESRLKELIQECEDNISQLNEKIKEYQKLLDELKDAPAAEILTDDYSVLLAEYRLYQENYSAKRQELQQRLQKTQDDIRKREKDILRFHIEPSEYENTVYSDEAYHRAEQQYTRAKEDCAKFLEQYSKVVEEYAKAKSSFEQAEDKLAELHTEPLPPSEVGSDFERRIRECERELNTVDTEKKECIKRLNDLNADRTITAKYAKKFEADIRNYTSKVTDSRQDTNAIQDSIEESMERLKQAENLAKTYHSRKLEPFRDTHTLFSGTLDGIISVIDNNSIIGDKYFTLYERTEDDIKRYQDRISQLAVLLKDVEDSRMELVGHCCQRVNKLYDNLKLLSNKSTIQIGGVKKQMIRIDLPDIEPMSEQPAERINDYITEQVKKYLSEQETSAKTYHDHLEIRRLLNYYIGQESIPIKVYKIDKNIQNSRYRAWQDALKANSGGEQFVVLFSLMVSVMNYSRNITRNLSSSNGVLILDNPFGPISSPHLLEPMFRIARHFHIQLICLTHLGTAAVTSFFDMVYQLRFKSLPLSNVEVMESQAKQHLEHAYYLSEQLSLF